MSRSSRKESGNIFGGLSHAERRHEFFGMVFLLAAAIVILSLASFSPNDPVFLHLGRKSSNLIGVVGAYLANGLLSLLGVASFVLVAALLYAAAVAFSKGGVLFKTRKVFGYVLLTMLGTVLCHIIFREHELLGHAPGGILGEYLGGLFLSLLSFVGSLVVVTIGIVLALIEVVGFSPATVARWSGRVIASVASTVGRALQQCLGFVGRALLVTGRWLGGVLAAEAQEFVTSLRDPMPDQTANETTVNSLMLGTGPVDEPPIITSRKSRRGSNATDFLVPPVSNPPGSNLAELKRREPVVVTSEPPLSAVTPPAEAENDLERTAKRSFKDIRRDHEPEIIIPHLEKKDEREHTRPPKDEQQQPQSYKDYHLPKIDLLHYEEQPQATIDEDTLREYARRLEGKLADYGVQGQVTKIMPGPVVTMYEYAPGPGIKVSRISGLANDLALALEAMSVRIVAPIPGRAVVGIEVANKERQTVFAKEILGHSVFQRSRSKLTMAFGKTIEGAPYVADLNKMPHLLVAGATGTGKSVALNTMICSILYRATPEDVRFIMVDPKVLELSLYEGIPHLLLPVVTDPRKAQAALIWAVNEMDRRIKILHSAGVRDLDSYNKKVERQQSGLTAVSPDQVDAIAPEKTTAGTLLQPNHHEHAPKKKVIVIDATAPDTASAAAPEGSPVPNSERAEPVLEPSEAASEATAFTATEAPPAVKPANKLPHVVIVIDELADLMMTSVREVETSVARIAQKARAAGIHLIIATQRPSVNVVTGLIKANLPARISFRVASKIDSRTILDANGADSLLGNGDMLFHPPTTSELVRIHGALITEEEIRKVVEHLKSQAKPVYDESILAAAEESEEDGEEEIDEFEDELYDLAVQIVSELGQASTSMVQRKLRIGYNRAARLVERMERDGIVGPADGSKPREVLVSNQRL
jgi:S-DNA-T family DNA segregation ATPase FtsK/SpoIIIE